MSSLDEDIELMVYNYRKVGDLLSRKVTIGEVRSFMIVDLALQTETEAELEKFFAIVKLMKQLREKETHA